MSSSYVLYNYTPSVAAAAIFVILFIVATCWHIFLAAKYKLKFLIAFIIGGLFEAMGYIARAINANESPSYSVMPYALQSVFILLAPSFFAASVYMILGRIIRGVDGNSNSLIRTTRLTKIFVCGDVLSFFIQSAGGGMLSSANSASSLKLGENIIVGGLIVQILFFGFFVIVSVVFHRRMNAHPTSTWLNSSVQWGRYMYVLYAESTMIMVRCIYRVIEYIQGSSGTLQSHEAFAYIFDATLMLLVMVIFIWKHPHQIMTKQPQQGDETELIYGRLG
ncbi:uncharacterized protein N7483_006120 [Penicillium malachiteum]|uniref:uncharacterized protein n=1 Tax=Penicillium malachiteum TaxID=1324776 RepID=UPI0025499275|nr:uncharacterized protein N7483_006120 [Penicillium malachiteum]KAJ5731612.1 hypothetical protein N7483_006120 [Penicillium malachiteum]